jgi:hypothetical protein
MEFEWEILAQHDLLMELEREIIPVRSRMTSSYPSSSGLGPPPNPKKDRGTIAAQVSLDVFFTIPTMWQISNSRL